MTSTAISAQGTTFEIGTGTGSAKTITAVQVGNPTILTIAAHGLNNGDVTALASLTGADAGLLNGQSVSVMYKTTNTIAVGIDTTGKAITPGTGTATPNTYTAVENMKDYSGFDGSASELDVTNMSSVAKEFRLGLVDNGQFTLNYDYDPIGPGQTALRAKRVSGALTSFRLTMVGQTPITWNGYVKKASLAGGVDAVGKSASDIRISGAVTGL